MGRPLCVGVSIRLSDPGPSVIPDDAELVPSGSARTTKGSSGSSLTPPDRAHALDLFGRGLLVCRGEVEVHPVVHDLALGDLLESDGSDLPQGFV
jgi:hypothetical protein